MRAMRSIDRGVAAAIFTLALLWNGALFISWAKRFGSPFAWGGSGLYLPDFGYFWGSARLFWLGKVSMVFHPDQFNAWLAGQTAPRSMLKFATWSYPPTMLVPLLPFGLLPATAALVLWLASTFALLAIVLQYLFADWRVTLTVLLSPAAFYSLFFCQNGALTAALLIAGLWMIDRRPVIAGACIGLLTIKPQLGILLPFALAAGGYWRAFSVAALTALLMFALTISLFGADAWAEFLHGAMPMTIGRLVHGYDYFPHQMMPTMLVTLQDWGASMRVASVGQGLSTLFAIVAVTWAWRRPQTDRQWRNALTCAASLLATPYGFVYDMIPAMLAVVLVTRAGLRGGFAWPERPILAAVWLWSGITSIHSLTPSPGLYPIGGFFLLAFVLCLVWRAAQNTGAWGEAMYDQLPSLKRASPLHEA